jgi:hypothetical protein
VPAGSSHSTRGRAPRSRPPRALDHEGPQRDEGHLPTNASDFATIHDPDPIRQTTHKPRRKWIGGSEILLRAGGFGALLAGVLFAIWGYVHRDNAPWYFDALATVLSFVVPALFLLGLTGLYVLCKGRVGRLGKSGLILALSGSAMGVAYAVPWSSFATREDWLSSLVWLDIPLVWWLQVLLAGLPLAGIAAVRTRTLRGLGTLLLVMAAFGWAYYATDAAAFLEARLAHVVLAALFSLGWIALGLLLLQTETR